MGGGGGPIQRTPHHKQIAGAGMTPPSTPSTLTHTLSTQWASQRSHTEVVCTCRETLLDP